MQEFGEERVVEIPICETTIAGSAVGAAVVGMRPIAEIMFADFLTLASDHIVNSAAKISFLEFEIQENQEDSTLAAGMMKEVKVNCIVTLGGRRDQPGGE